jgi:hypothetical protein
MISPAKIMGIEVMYRVTIQARKFFISSVIVLMKLNFDQADELCGLISLQVLTPLKGRLTLDDSLI